MRANLIKMIAVLGLVGCASDDAVETSESAGLLFAEGEIAKGTWPPAAKPEAGYLRFKATPIPGIKPGTDATYCQYIMPPVEEDMNVLEVKGGQPVGGHHLTVYGVDADKMKDHPMNTPWPCEPQEGHSDLGTWLGSALVSTPKGAAFRLKKGKGLLLNLHTINTGDEPLEGDGYFDIKMVPAKDNPDQPLAAIFAAVNANINVLPGQKSSSSVDCVVGADMDFVMAANHMHEWGASARTTIIRGDTKEEIVLVDDPFWRPESQLNPDFRLWSVAEPFRVRKGDVIRTACTWMNSSRDVLTFPREMCISSAFMMLPKGVLDTPGACQAGRWVPAQH